MKKEKVFSSFEDMAKAIGELPEECPPLAENKTLNKPKQSERPKQFIPKTIVPSPVMTKDNPALKPIKAESELINIVCIDCGVEFVVPPNEAKFYNEKGFALPKRCKNCRAKKKAERENFNWNSL